MASRLYRLLTRYYKELFRDYAEDEFYNVARETMGDEYWTSNCHAVNLYKCRLINFRLGRTHNISFNDEKINFDIELCSCVSFNNEYYTDEIVLYAQCSMVLEDTVKKFKIESLSRTKQDLRFLRDGVIADSNLVPILSKDDLDKEAQLFLRKFCPSAFEVIEPVPIDYIAEYELGLQIIDGCTISEDKNMLAQFTLANTVVNGLHVKANTIVLNKPALDERGSGCRQFTLGHESYHDWRHRYYLTLKKLVDDEEMTFIDFVDNNDDSEKWLEWQADKVASRILMPTDIFVARLSYYFDLYHFFDANYDEYTLYQISKAIAKDFNVSRKAAAIRIKELNIMTGDMDVTDCNYEYLTIYDFSNHSATTHYRHISGGNTLYRYNVSKELIELTNDNSSISLTRDALNMLQEEDKYNDLIKEDLGATLKAIRESKNYSPYFIASEAGIDRNTVVAIEENLTQNIDVYNIVLICKALSLTSGLTKRLICKKLHDFENTMKDKMIEYCIDNFFVEDINSFKYKLDKAVSESKLIDESQRELRKAC